MACVPLISETASLASSIERLDPRGLQRVGAARCGRPCRHGTRLRRPEASARWASGARSPDAPTLPCDGHPWRHAAREQFADRVDSDRAHAGKSLGERIGAQQHHGAGFGDGKRVADAHGVRAYQVDLQFADLVAGDAHVAEFADAGGDGVGDLIVGDQACRPRRARRSRARAHRERAARVGAR